VEEECLCNTALNDHEKFKEIPSAKLFVFLLLLLLPLSMPSSHFFIIACSIAVVCDGPITNKIVQIAIALDNDPH